MEAFGLAMIVILLTIGLFIYVSLRSNTPKSSPIKDYTTDEMAVNFINSLVSVSVEECYDYKLTISDLVRYCATSENIRDRCNGKDA